jgi:uncharacterized protein (TIGR03083 family)
MQLTPRYGTDPIIVLDGDLAAIAGPVVAQRRRLVAELGALDDAQWATPSRCEGWTVQDVIVHLEGTNAFWGYSIGCGLAGEPSQLLATFDPVASPAQMVRDAGSQAPGAVLERFATSCDRLERAFAALDDDGWAAMAEAPPGHLSISLVAHHALWDSWVHERDVLLPLGIVPPAEPDEVVACLRYASALSPAFAVAYGDPRSAILVVESVDPSATVVVRVDATSVTLSDDSGEADGAVVLRGGGVELIEALSMRSPMPGEVPSEAEWMLGGLAQVFDQVDDA